MYFYLSIPYFILNTEMKYTLIAADKCIYFTYMTEKVLKDSQPVNHTECVALGQGRNLICDRIWRISKNQL